MKVYVTETLQREVDIEASDEFEALSKLEELYNDGEIVLDYSDLVNTDFTSTTNSKKEINIMGEIGDFCNQCPSLTECPEGECVLYRIERIIEDGFYEV